MKRVDNHAFTMIELLVVVGIILMLAALLMPTLSRIRETVKNVKCINNLRQISMITHLYASDYSGLPPWNPDMAGDSLFIRWSRDPKDGNGAYDSKYPTNKWFSEYFSEQTPYGSMSASAYCPSGGRFGPRGPNVPISAGKGSKQNFVPNISYGINHQLANPGWFYQENDGDRSSVLLNQVKNPSKVCLWIDASKTFTYPIGWSLDGRHYSKSKLINGDTPSKNGHAVYRCHGRANVVFVDQRIGFVTISGPEDPYGVSSDPGTQFWNDNEVNESYPESQGQSEDWGTVRGSVQILFSSLQVKRDCAAIPRPIKADAIQLFHALTCHRSLGSSSAYHRQSQSFIISYQDALARKGDVEQLKILRPAA